MPRMKMFVSGFDGTQTYAAGDAIDTALDHARRALIRGHGRLLDDDNRVVPLAKAITTLRLPDDDVLAIETEDKVVAALQTRINSERED